MTTLAPAFVTTLRAYTAADRPTVRRIACLTAFRNLGHAAVLPDAALFADYWTSYYTDFEPERLVIAEVVRDARSSIVGYLSGCCNTRQHQRIMARHIVPSVLRRLTGHALQLGSGEGRRARRLLRWMVMRAWREVPHLDSQRFPAHYHANLLQEGAGFHFYTRMAVAFVEQLEQSGIAALHGQVTEWQERGPWGRMVRRFMDRGLTTVGYTEAPSTMHREVLGESRPMMNRTIYGSTRDFRAMLLWARDSYGI
ncbi:MAG: hypothetical protein U0132_02475 [Gemmatimonadaceae bacterium]